MSDPDVIDLRRQIADLRRQVADLSTALRRLPSRFGGGAGKDNIIRVADPTHTLAVGDVVRLGGLGTWIKAAADDEDERVYGGVVVAAAPAGFTVATCGEHDGFTGLVAGTLYYLQDDGTLGTDPSETAAIPVLVATGETTGVVLTYSEPGSDGGQPFNLYNLDGVFPERVQGTLEYDEAAEAPALRFYKESVSTTTPMIDLSLIGVQPGTGWTTALRLYVQPIQVCVNGVPKRILVLASDPYETSTS